VHSNKDIVVMAISVFLVEQHLPEAQLVIYLRASRKARRMRIPEGGIHPSVLNQKFAAFYQALAGVL
jgi:hypothetical protein